MSTVATRKFSVADYYKMVEAGILRDDDRVELIEGTIVEIAPIGSRHAACVERLSAVLHHALGPEQASVRVQLPLRLSDESEPEPDVVLARFREDFYSAGHPKAEDVLLLIEVDDRSLEFDRETKVPLYARAGVREVWRVDIPHERIEVYRRAGARGYEARAYAGVADILSPDAFPNLDLRVRDIMP